MRQSRAFTLVEILVVIAITATLMAIILPAMSSAMRSAKSTQTMSQLRQLHVAVMLYQADHGGGGTYGTLEEMGLPSAEWLFLDPVLRPLFLSPCGRNPSSPSDYGVWYFPLDGAPPFPERARIFQENLILAFDMQCSDPAVNLYNQYAAKKGIGVLLQGSGVVRIRKGDWRDPLWWADPY